MLAKGFTLGKDALNARPSPSTSSAPLPPPRSLPCSLHQKMGLGDKISASMKARQMDDKFRVSEKTKSAFSAADQTVTSAVINNRYVLTGVSWVAGAFSRVTKAAGEAGHKT